MVRAILVAVVLSGCVDVGLAPNNLAVRVGDACPMPALLCADGAGVCAAGTCRAQCSLASYPRCGADEAEAHADLGAGTVSCYCVPR